MGEVAATPEDLVGPELAASAKGREIVTALTISGNLVKDGMLEQGMQLLEKLLAEAREISSQYLEATVLHSMAAVQFSSENWERAHSLSEQALTIARMAGNTWIEVLSLHVIGLIDKSTGKIESALRSFHEALEITQEKQWPHLEASTLNDIAVAYAQTGDTEQEVAFYERALVIWREIGDQRSELNTLNNMAQLYESCGQSHSALYIWEKALTICRQLHDTARETVMLSNMAYIHTQSGNIQVACELREQVYRNYETHGDASAAAAELLAIAQLRVELGQIAEALDDFENLISQFQNLSEPAKLAESQAMFGVLLYMHTDRIEEASHYIEQAIAALESAGLLATHSGYDMPHLHLLLSRMQHGEALTDSSAVRSRIADEQLQTIVLMTAAVLTDHREQAAEFRREIDTALRYVLDRDLQPESEFLSAVLEMLDGVQPNLSMDHAYAESVQAINRAILGGIADELKPFLSPSDGDSAARSGGLPSQPIKSLDDAPLGGEISEELLKILVCPQDKGPLMLVDDGKFLLNPRNGYKYPIRNGLPVMLIEEGKKYRDPNFVPDTVS